MNLKPQRNKYCIDKEDLMIPHRCKCCTQCYIYVQSYKNRKNGTCPFGGPFTGYIKDDGGFHVLLDRLSNK